MIKYYLHTDYILNYFFKIYPSIDINNRFINFDNTLHIIDDDF